MEGVDHVDVVSREAELHFTHRDSMQEVVRLLDLRLIPHTHLHCGHVVSPPMRATRR